MKKLLVVSVFLIIAFFRHEPAHAQKEYSKVNNELQGIDSSEYSLRHKYKYLEIILKDEKNLLKVGYNPSFLESGGIIADPQFIKLPIDIAFEKKIFLEWSLIAEYQISYRIGYQKQIGSYSLNMGARYYYGMKKAYKEGNSGNNVNSHYLELSINGIPAVSTKASYIIAWGIQQRLNKYTFIDTKVFAWLSV